MALQFKKIMRVWCPICGYMKEYDPSDLKVSIPFRCPACNDGTSKTWSKQEANEGAYWESYYAKESQE
jgi:hypothetical protein